MPKESKTTVTWEGHKIPMILTPSGWRARKRSKHLDVDFSTNILGLQPAQRAVKKHLDEQKDKEVQAKSKKTLADVVQAYQSMPKRASEQTEYVNVTRLNSAVRLVLKKSLNEVPSNAIDAAFWMKFIALKQGREVADLATRAVENVNINSAIRSAKAVFKKSLLPAYAAAGITIAPDVNTVQLLPKMRVPKAKADDAAMIKAWALLNKERPALWATVGAARFAGLRKKEIMFLAKHWIEMDGKATYIRICDRPKEGFLTKTGENYRALVIHEGFAQFLRAAPAGLIVEHETKLFVKEITRETWFYRYPQEWLKPFTGESTRPLHRLRGLYADHLAKLTADAVTARLAGVKAAAEALGHTTSKTTEDHYLSGEV